ncbi:MAG: hypothetical protein ACP5QI_01890 [Candidatus Bathyarchaeia archaeon]
MTIFDRSEDLNSTIHGGLLDPSEISRALHYPHFHFFYFFYYYYFFEG